jgi:hypothetical protein
MITLLFIAKLIPFQLIFHSTILLHKPILKVFLGQKN